MELRSEIFGELNRRVYGKVSRQGAKYAKGAKGVTMKVLYFLCALGVLCALA